MIRFALLAATAALSLAACTTQGEQMAAAAAASGDMTPTAAPAYVAMAASSDMFEIRSSQLALSRSQNAGVRQFAQMMIDHHTRTTQALTAAAASQGITPPMQMLPMHAQMLARLQAAGSGTSFDAAYGREQRVSHEAALALHSNYASNGDNPALRTVAGTATPVVQQHLQMTAQLPS